MAVTGRRGTRGCCCGRCGSRPRRRRNQTPDGAQGDVGSGQAERRAARGVARQCTRAGTCAPLLVAMRFVHAGEEDRMVMLSALTSLSAL